MKRRQRFEEVLETEDIEVLAGALAPIEPAPAARLSMRERLLERARQASAPQTVLMQEGEWVALSPLVEVKKLFRDDTGNALLYRVQPGGVLPDHHHFHDEECLVLEGEMTLGELQLRAGDFHRVRKGTEHRQIYSRTGAVFYVRNTTL